MYNSYINYMLPAETSTGDDTTIFALLDAAHALEDRLESALNRAGLSTPKYSVLKALVASDGPLSLSDLASELSCVRSNMTQLVDRLEADGLVKRVDDPADRRVVKAAITEEGKRRQEAGANEIDALHREFAARVDAADRAALQRLLAVLK
jgi:DNA-binding MarR family transcriptional regulator